jgi:hypothetical protein
VLGFLLRYCDTALSKVSGTDEPLQDGAMRVFRQLGNIDRFRELFGTKLPDDRLSDPTPMKSALTSREAASSRSWSLQPSP